MSLLEVTSLQKIYTTRLGGSRVQALKSVSFSVSRGNTSPSWASPAPARPRS